MKLSDEQKAALRADFKKMTASQKLGYIFDYYKFPIIIAILVVVFVVSTARRMAAQKEPILYLGAVNVSWSDDMEAVFTEDFVRDRALDPNKNEVYVYYDLNLSDDASANSNGYSYASNMKLMAAAYGDQLDILLMNREAYDLLSRSAYLADLSGLLDPELAEAVSDQLTYNDVIVEDNSLEALPDEDGEALIVTERSMNGILITELRALQGAGFDEDVYLGVGAGIARPDMVKAYIQYLAK